jgi:hypothetical protein
MYYKSEKGCSLGLVPFCKCMAVYASLKLNRFSSPKKPKMTKISTNETKRIVDLRIKGLFSVSGWLGERLVSAGVAVDATFVIY